MSEKKRKNRDNSNGGGGFIFGSVSFIIICAALVFAMSVFFRVSKIEVVGNGRYSASEVIESSGIKDGDNLVFLQCDRIEEKLYKKLIYISTAEVSRKLPNKVTIKISESSALAVVETDSGLWLIDKNCRLLGECTAAEAAPYINIIGLCALEPEIGETLSAQAEDAPRIKYLKAILSGVESFGVISKVDALDVSNSANAEFRYDGRFTVKLGKNEYIDNKMQILLGAVSELGSEETGIIDISEEKRAHFNPDE